MKDAPIGTKQNRGAKVVEHEIRALTFPPGQQEEDGYQIRFLLQPGLGSMEVWTEWIFLSHKAMEDHLHSLNRYLREQGHLSSSLDKSVQ